MLHESLNYMHGNTKRALETHSQYYMKIYNKNRPAMKIQEGNLIFLTHLYNQITAKMDIPTTGPFQIKKIYWDKETNQPKSVILDVG